MTHLLAAQDWLIEEGYLSRVVAILQSGRAIDGLVKKQNLNDYNPRLHTLLSFTEVEAHAMHLQNDYQLAESSGLPVVQTKQGNIALMPVVGPMTKYGDLCSMGMQDYQSIIAKVNADPNIDGLVMVMDTPGGTVDGTPEFGLVVKNSTKPIGVFGDGMVASAGMWVASQADVIVGNKNNPTAFGSIGTLMIKEDLQNLVDSGRMQKVEIVRAPQSTEKALINSIEPLTDATRGMVTEHLRAITSDFIATVKSGRGDALDTTTEGLFKGRMYDAYRSKQAGLIDSVGTLQTAINKVAELAKQKNKMNNGGMAANEDTMSKPNWFVSVFGNSEKETAGLTEEQALEAGKKEVAALQASLKAAEEKEAALSARISTLEGELTTAQQSAKEAGEKVNELTNSLAEAKAELEKKPTGHKTTVVPAQEREKKGAGESNTQKIVSEADQEAAAYADLVKNGPPKKFTLTQPD